MSRRGARGVTALLLRDEAASGDLLARALLVDDVAAWRRLSERRRGLVLVARTAEVQPDSRSRRRRLSGRRRRTRHLRR